MTLLSKMERLKMLLNADELPLRMSHPIDNPNQDGGDQTPDDLPRHDSSAHLRTVDMTLPHPQKSSHVADKFPLPARSEYKGRPGSDSQSANPRRPSQPIPIRARAESNPTEGQSLSGSESDIMDDTVFLDSRSQLLIGTLAEPGELFCPIVAISRYPYKFVRDRQLSEKVDDAYFNEGKFWRRPWSVYYVWPMTPGAGKPLLLVPLEQVSQLLQDVNESVKDARLSLLTVSDTSGLVVTFNYEHPQLRPRYLGFSTSREVFQNLEQHAPGPKFRPNFEVATSHEPNADDVKSFSRALDDAADLGKKKKSTKNERSEQRLQKEQDWRRDLRQAERFLGLRPASINERGLAPEILEARKTESWQDYQSRLTAEAKAKEISPIQITSLPPHPFESNVIFVSIDLEAWERGHGVITEVGLSTLDTADIASISPGDRGENWFSKIRSRHFRIREASHLVNTDFVRGNPGDFRFGQSEFVNQKDAAQLIESCFSAPFSSRQDTHPEGVALLKGEAVQEDQRTVVIVGHDFDNDIRHLKRLGFYVKELKNLHPRCPIIDTQSLYGAYTSASDPQSLANVLQHLEITPYGLHNAGNDATYTMQAMLGLAVCSASERRKKPSRLGESLETEGSDAGSEYGGTKLLKDGAKGDVGWAWC